MNEIFKVIFGDYTFIQLFGFFWFLVIGYIIYGLNEVSSRDVHSPVTPVPFKWTFWFKDNWRRYLVTILSTYVFFRFYIEFVGHELTNFEALMMGLIGDGIGATAKKKISAVAADRKQLMAKFNASELKADQKVVADSVKSDQEFIVDELKSDQKVVADKLVNDQKTIADELKK